MWNVAETQFRTIADDHARQRAAARGEQLARAAGRTEHESLPNGRAPDVPAQRRRSDPAAA